MYIPMINHAVLSCTVNTVVYFGGHGKEQGNYESIDAFIS